MGSKERGQHILEKYIREQEHIQYLLDHGMSSLEIAEQMMEYSTTLLREVIKQNHPNWKDQEILIEMRRKIESEKTIHKRRGLRQTEGY